MKFYEVLIAIVYRSREKGELEGIMLEKQLSAVIRVKDMNQAIYAGLTWLVDRTAMFAVSLEECKGACVKVHGWEPGRFFNGILEPDRISPFTSYEWKYDRGVTLEEEIKQWKKMQ